jgi:hypothetical protein
VKAFSLHNVFNNCVPYSSSAQWPRVSVSMLSNPKVTRARINRLSAFGRQIILFHLAWEFDYTHFRWKMALKLGQLSFLKPFLENGLSRRPLLWWTQRQPQLIIYYYSLRCWFSIFPWENVILLVILTCGPFLHITLIWATGREFLLNTSSMPQKLFGSLEISGYSLNQDLWRGYPPFPSGTSFQPWVVATTSQWTD